MDNENIEVPCLKIVESTAEVSTQDLCRLCLQFDSTNTRLDIFEDKLQEGTDDQKSLEEVLYDLFHIKYAKIPGMPHVVCQRCLEMVKAFNKFRKIIEKSEARLKCGELNFINNKSHQNEDYIRPGLNGNSGIFIPEEDCEIIEVNPDQDCSSSDDDFSIESDTDGKNTPEISERTEMAVKSQVLPSKEDTLIIPQISNKDTALTSNEVATPTTTNGKENLPYEHKNAYLCQYCDMAFTIQADCVKHETQHSPNTPYNCPICPVHHVNRQNLISHIRAAHSTEKPYVCVLCTKGFCRRCDLKKHSIVHTGIRPYTCSICRKSFSRNTTLKKHLLIHSSAQPYVCQHCPRSFATAAELLQHSYLHTIYSVSHPNTNNISISKHGEQTENLMQQSLLLQHQRQQQPSTTVTPTATTVNQKITATSRTTHHRLHICNICSKSFTRERDLQRHQALHLDTLFTCKQCGVGFSRREKLTRHEVMEHAPHYTCNICNVTFLKNEELEEHLKMHELQKNVAISTQQAVAGAASVIQGNNNNNITSKPSVVSTQQQQQQQTMIIGPSAADLSFYSNMVPTMNLGFYNETRPEDDIEV